MNDMALFTVKMMLDCVHLEEQREIDKAAKSIAAGITEIFDVSFFARRGLCWNEPSRNCVFVNE